MLTIRSMTLLLGAALAAAPGLVAQEPGTDLPTGVRLGLVYETTFRPRLAVQPFTGVEGADSVAAGMQEIVERDLDYSDRFDMLGRVPGGLRASPVDYEAWNDLDVVYLVTGHVERSGGGYLLRLALHDVVYANVQEIRAFEVPPPDAADYRVSVHAASDEVVRWATGEPGVAASRIAMTVRRTDGSHELLLVDSDGQELRRVTLTEDQVLSPAWGPDGSRLAYAISGPEGWRIEERDLRTGRIRIAGTEGGQLYTPAYSADGSRLAYARWVDGSGQSELFDYDARQYCCERRLTRNPKIDMSPTYSPDGRRVAFLSDRLGPTHIFVMRSEGGDASVLSPFVYGESGAYFAPDWSAKGSLVTFHGSRRRGEYQIMVADADRMGATVLQLTSQGRNEDPSWAPDGRHIVFTGMRPEGPGLYVIDSVTGRIRPLITGVYYRVPAWSPRLTQATSLATGEP